MPQASRYGYLVDSARQLEQRHMQASRMCVVLELPNSLLDNFIVATTLAAHQQMVVKRMAIEFTAN